MILISFSVHAERSLREHPVDQGRTFRELPLTRRRRANRHQRNLTVSNRHRLRKFLRLLVNRFRRVAIAKLMNTSGPTRTITFGKVRVVANHVQRQLHKGIRASRVKRTHNSLMQMRQRTLQHAVRLRATSRRLTQLNQSRTTKFQRVSLRRQHLLHPSSLHADKGQEGHAINGRHQRASHVLVRFISTNQHTIVLSTRVRHATVQIHRHRSNVG